MRDAMRLFIARYLQFYLAWLSAACLPACLPQSGELSIVA